MANDRVIVVNQSQPVGAARLRLGVAIGLGAISIAASLLLVIADGLDASVKWKHHAGVSAAPLLLVAGAIAAVSIAHPPKGRHVPLRVVAVVAFASWGLAQLFPNSGAAGGLNDAAILLFVLEAGLVVISDARTHLRLGRPADSPTDTGRHTQPA